jgi:glycosyltransferase involved in cell wall biosynthesis
MDEIWVPTPFVSQAVTGMAPDLSSRVRIVPTAIGADPMPKATTVNRINIREKLKIHRTAFVSGFTFSMESCFERKNPLAALAAFKKAFPSEQDDVNFILRCHDADHYPDGHNQIRASISGDPRIILLDTYDNYIPVQKFYEAIDTFVSLHRSEGFGLTIAEAEQSGASVICTGWGLAPELEAKSAIRTVCSTMIPLRDPQRLYRPSPKDFWAEPNLEQAASLLRTEYSMKIAHPLR